MTVSDFSKLLVKKPSHRISRKITCEEVVVGGVKEQIVIAPNTDVILVPRTAIANANMWAHQHVQDLLPFPISRFPPF
jgi:hypothetical protein